MDKVRYAAFQILNRIERDQAYSNLLLNEYFSDLDFDARDSAFLNNLVRGVLERLFALDYALSLCLKQPLKKLKPQVLTILRLGAFQILYMEKVPVSAAVNESVKLSKKTGSAFASGLINGVLRNVVRNGEVYPDKNENKIRYLSVRYSFPEKTVEMLLDAYGEEKTLDILESSLEKTTVYGRVNRLKTDFNTLKVSLAKKDIIIDEQVFPQDAFVFKSPVALSLLQEFNEGLFYIQDLSSQICAAAIAAEAGERVLDVCAAPGGKSFLLAMKMENEGTVISCDIHEHKIELIKKGASRLGLENINTLLRDALSKEDDLPLADHVLCDVPCSGFGVVGRKPEIKYKSLDSLEGLPEIQLEILKNSSRFVKAGGSLTYSTCTLNPKENEDVCREFLTLSPEFKQLKVLPQLEGRGGEKSLNIFPSMFSSDGFFIAQFERIT